MSHCYFSPAKVGKKFVRLDHKIKVTHIISSNVYPKKSRKVPKLFRKAYF